VVLDSAARLVPSGCPARRLAVASLSPVCGVIFGVGIAMGQLPTVIGAWVIGGLASLILMMADKPAGPGSDIPL
jgi:hypothetical protein